MGWKCNRGLQVIMQGLNTTSEHTAWLQVIAVHALHPSHSQCRQGLCLGLPGSTGPYMSCDTHTHRDGLDGLAEVSSERFPVPR